MPAVTGDRTALDSAIDDVLRELAYCAAGPGWRFRTGQVAAAQTTALAKGWLRQHRDRPGYLEITASGQARIARR